MILLIHHLEPCWDYGYNKVGTNFDELEWKVAKYIERYNPNRVILTRHDEFEIDHVFYPNLIHYVDRVYNYAYGWEADMFENENEYCQGGYHSQVVQITDWLRELKVEKVSLCGAFLGECLEDMEIALKFVKAKFKLLHSLCV